jgi:hypothetical protein
VRQVKAVVRPQMDVRDEERRLVPQQDLPRRREIQAARCAR